jgi:hypothetical protein
MYTAQDTEPMDENAAARKDRKMRCALILILSGLASVSWAKVDLATLPQRDAVQLTIYNSADLTLVREARSLTLKDGENELQFSWANTLIDPTSLEMFPKADRDKIDITDLTYPPRVSNLGLWNLNSQATGEVPIQISYLTSGLSWRAFYMGTLSENEQTMRLQGYVRVSNNSGEDYANAQTRLIVGRVHLLDEIADLARRRYPYDRPGEEIQLESEESADMGAVQAKAERAWGDLLQAQARPKEIKKEGLSEYFLYTIEGKETIPNGFSKRLLSFETDNVPVVNLYKYEHERYGDSVRRFLSFKNDTEHQLGETPIPGGMLKVYRTVDDAEHFTYLGQSVFKYIPVDEDVELDIGSVEDVVVKPTLMAFRTDNYKYEPNGNIIGWDELQTYKIEAKNTRPVPVEIRIQRNFGKSEWELTTEQEYERVDLDTVKFTLELGPRSRQEFEYVFKISHQIEYFGPKQPIGWWKFDDTSGTVALDSSGRKLHGNIEGGPNWSADGGRFGGCLVFSDDTSVILPQNVLEPIDRQVTISVWLKDAVRSGNHNTVFDAGDGDFNLQAAVGGTNTGHDLYFRAGTESDDVLTWNPPGRSERFRGWHHYVFVKDEVGDHMRVYFDGSLGCSKPDLSSSLYKIRNAPFKMGAKVEHMNDFVGSIDDFRIYNRAFSNEQVRRLYNKASRRR